MIDSKIKSLIISILLCASNAAYANNTSCPIIPLPESWSMEKGELQLSDLQYIAINDNSLRDVAYFLQKELLAEAGLSLYFHSKDDLARSKHISLQLAEKKDKGYSLLITPHDVTIVGNDTESVFHGIISFLQLVKLNQSKKIACCRVEDKPAMQWRGLMLDESRHFFGKETVKEILDWMAFYKLNRFHWHLTDRQGWRIEIKNYPKLALVGGIGNHTDTLAPARFYTQQEISEIVRYAKERFIEVIPEIDMPGHATAANRAYPEYSADGIDNPPGFTFNPGMEETYSYLTRILKEINVLFPAGMIHMGGDEVHFGNQKWEQNPHIQELMKRENFKNMKEAETYFNRRMADSILAMDAKVLGWDEIADAGMTDRENTILFWWRANQQKSLQEALNRGFQVVLCPNIPFYLDYNQDIAHKAGRRSGQIANTSEDIYNFSTADFPDIITDENRDLILGMQVNIWTERIRSKDRLQYVLFPRMAALAEAAWGDEKNYNKFKERLSGHLALYQRENIRFYNVLNPESTPEISDIDLKVKK